jgi:hypothetical protein
MTAKKRVELYRRLPEIYRIKDEDLPKNFLYGESSAEAFQLKNYLAPVEDMFSAVHENIESLYHDFFIETCDEWVIPYIADLLGTSHLSGDAWTLRADVANTIALRRRKGTLGAIELLTYILTKWGVHTVELRENLVWNQHLNHQRPDEGGFPPYSLPKIKRQTPIRGGTMNLRDPSTVALLGKPFSSFAHVADVRPHKIGQIRYNLPNLAIYLWRLKDFRLHAVKPFCEKAAQAGGAPLVVRASVNPIPVNNLSAPYVKAGNEPAGQPVTLFNTNRLELFNQSRKGTGKLNLSAIAPRISGVDEVPAPIPVERIGDAAIAREYDDFLNSDSPLSFEELTEGRMIAPQKYVSVETYDETKAELSLNLSDVGFQLHLPQTQFPDEIWLHKDLPRAWTIRGENLCAWEKGLQPVLQDREIAIDPLRGRVCIGVLDEARADALIANLLLTFTYGAVGEVGAHPISYASLPPELDKAQTPSVNYYTVKLRENENGLRDALKGISQRAEPTVIEIADSFTHFLDLKDIELASDVIEENGVHSLKLNAPLVIRAADNQRPIIGLARPLGFRPANVTGADEEQQNDFDAVMNDLFVRLEGLFLARDLNFASYLLVAERKNEPLIARAALNRLEILSCTLDPGGFRRFDGSRAPNFPALRLFEPYGFNDADDEREFKQTPEIVVQRSVCGTILTDEGYRLCLTDSIIDAGQGVGDTANDKFAISGATNTLLGFAGQTIIRNVTVFGRTRVAGIEGSGAIFVHSVEVQNQQIGCLKYCYFADEANFLPQNYACVNGKTAKLFFTSEIFGAVAYAQLSLECDRRILEEGVGSDQMGAFNFLSEAHKWRNLRIRFREFMPVGIRPLLIPVT